MEYIILVTFSFQHLICNFDARVDFMVAISGFDYIILHDKIVVFNLHV